jgi:hypothetical protein
LGCPPLAFDKFELLYKYRLVKVLPRTYREQKHCHVKISHVLNVVGALIMGAEIKPIFYQIIYEFLLVQNVNTVNCGIPVIYVFIMRIDVENVLFGYPDRILRKQ